MNVMLDVDAQVRQGEFRLNARFSVPTNAVTALFGPSGAGKTTLLGAIAGLKRLNNGFVVLNGTICTDVRRGIHIPVHKRGIGIVFQDARLFPHLSVRENIIYAQRRAPKNARFQIPEIARFFEVEALLDRPVNNLSGGEKSRVALARALLSAPQFLLLDEPFTALDGTRRQDFIDILLAMHRDYGIPMMIVTHEIDDAAALATHIIGIQDGRVVTSGAFNEVSHGPEFQALLDSRNTGAALAPGASESTHGRNSRGAWLRADHVLLALERPHGISARNVIAGHILSITPDRHRGLLAAIQTPSGIVLSRVTSEAVDELSLVAGMPVWAIFKAHAF